MSIDQHGNAFAREGVDFCPCGAKYWERDRCVSCGELFSGAPQPTPPCRPVPEPLPTNDALGEPVCAVHGGFWQESGCLTRAVLEDVAAHRQFQFENYGPNRDVEDGVGPDVDWLAPVVSEFTAGDGSLSARAIEGLFRQEWDYDVNPDPAERTWMRMLREEVAETFASDNAIGLEAELIQVAALAVSWVEKIRERSVSSDV